VIKDIVERCSSYSNFVEQRFRCITVQLQGFADAVKRREQVRTVIISTLFFSLRPQMTLASWFRIQQ